MHAARYGFAGATSSALLFDSNSARPVTFSKSLKILRDSVAQRLGGIKRRSYTAMRVDLGGGCGTAAEDNERRDRL